MAGDLNLKKSWNPALIKNQKKIWEEEQQKLNEHKKIGELSKELEKEEEFKEMLTMRYGKNFKQSQLTPSERLRLNKLNWMYQGPQEGKVNSAGFIEKEEFTAEKDKVENMLNGSRYVKNTNTGDRMSRVIQSGRSEVKNRTDDPLMIMNRERRRVRERTREKNEQGNERKKGRSEGSEGTRRDGNRDGPWESRRGSHRDKREMSPKRTINY